MVETGTSSDYADLLSKLRTFLTSTLSVGEQWTELRYVSTAGSEELILEGQGDGDDQIFIGIKAYVDTINDNYAWILNGFTGFNSALSFYNLPGAIQISEFPTSLALLKSVPTNPSAIQYWFIANSRRVIVIVRTGTVYHACYLGFFLPYGTPLQYAYPLCIGGSSLVSSAGVPRKQSDTFGQVHSFWRPISSTDITNNYNTNAGNLAFRDPAGTWKRPFLQSSGLNASLGNGTWPYCEEMAVINGGIANMRSNLDNSYTLLPIMIVTNDPHNVYGEFEGIRHLSGFNLTSEDVVQIDGDDWLCIQNVFQTGDGHMAAYRLI